MNTEIEKLIDLLDQTFHKGAWHGPSVMEALDGVSDTLARQRLPETHSIIELVAHMTSWRTYVIRKLAGDETYRVTEEQNFPAGDDWAATLQQLLSTQQQLITALQGITDAKLAEPVPGKSPLTFFTLLHGIIHHDLYHTGQISLIKKTSGYRNK